MFSRSGAACDLRDVTNAEAVTAGRDHSACQNRKNSGIHPLLLPSVMMPASRRQLALKDMKEADGASMMGKISSRFTADFMGPTPFFSLDRLGGGAAKMSPTDRSCHLYVW